MKKKLSRRALNRVVRAALRANHDPRLNGKRPIDAAFYALVLCRSFPERFLCHLKTVLVHKTFVFLYCAYAGRPIRGLTHDLSKFSPVEFLNSVKFYSGRCSPVGLERKIQGYSLAWLHHKGRNAHHYEYWHDVVDENGLYCAEKNKIYPLPMPFPNAIESVCDSIAASRAYNGSRFSYDRLMEWWIESHRKPVNMHPQTERFAQAMFEELQRAGNCRPLRRAKEIYRQTQNAR